MVKNKVQFHWVWGHSLKYMRGTGVYNIWRDLHIIYVIFPCILLNMVELFVSWRPFLMRLQPTVGGSDEGPDAFLRSWFICFHLFQTYLLADTSFVAYLSSSHSSFLQKKNYTFCLSKCYFLLFFFVWQLLLKYVKIPFQKAKRQVICHVLTKKLITHHNLVHLLILEWFIDWFKKESPENDAAQGQEGKWKDKNSHVKKKTL